MPSKFEPGPGEEFVLTIDGRRYGFRSVPHPAAPASAHVISAGRADVHRVQELASKSEYALKVFMARHRGPQVAEACARLDAHKRSGGLSVCDRRCLSPGRADETIADFPNLAFAVLMPWVRGESWFDVLAKGKSGGSWSEADGTAFALRLATVLFHLERSGMAHGDVSSGNVILNRQSRDLQLVDVEDLYAPGWPRPQSPSTGTPGYRHRNIPADVWSAAADRFAAGILLCEMLTWSNAGIRSLAHGESYFDQTMIDQADNGAYAPLRAAVSRWGPDLVSLLDCAWSSADVNDCPSLSDWHGALQAAAVGRYGITIEPVSRTPAVKPPFWIENNIPVDPPKIEWGTRQPPPVNKPEWK
jgi:serine/threonine protein kinase